MSQKSSGIRRKKTGIGQNAVLELQLFCIPNIGRKHLLVPLWQNVIGVLPAVELQQHVGSIVEKGVLDLPCTANTTAYISEVSDFLGVVANVLLCLLLICVVLLSLRRGNSFLLFLPSHMNQMVLPYECLSKAVVERGQGVRRGV